MSVQISRESLIASLAEIERHVTSSGWDQPARLFALVSTQGLIEAEPTLAGHLTATAADALSAIEQDEFVAGDDWVGALRRITWPPRVVGCALAVERTFLSPDLEQQIPTDPDEAARFVSTHPSRQDVRVVVGALRDGQTHGVARLVSNPDDLLGAEDLVPGLSALLIDTLKEH